MVLGFVDAYSYSCVIYLLILTETGVIRTQLICAKSIVSPLKVQWFPRLELCAAVLLAKLFKFPLDTLGVRNHIENIYAFSDSMVVLHWIHSSPYRWNTFVANRVSKIHNCLPFNVWLHVEGKDNTVGLNMT